jgi:hypothetical protein
MRIALLAVAAALGSLSLPAVAHPGGHDDESRPQRRPIAELAQESVVKLVTQAKLPASWAKVKPRKSEIRTKNGGQQWVVTFENPAERNRAKRMLYVIMSTEGSFISANHKLV